MGPVKPIKSEGYVTTTVPPDNGSVHNADSKNNKNTKSGQDEQSLIIQKLLKMEIEGFEPVLPSTTKEKVKLTNEKMVSSPLLSDADPRSMMEVVSTYFQKYPIFVYFFILLIMTIRYIDLDFVNVFLFIILICYTVQRFSVFELFYLGFTTPICEWKTLLAKNKKPEREKKTNKNTFTVKAIKIVDELVRNDPYYAERKSIVDLRTGTEARASRYNFFGLIRIMDDSQVHLCEMDSDSHISIIDEDYFNANLKGKIDKDRFLDEDAPSFKGITGE